MGKVILFSPVGRTDPISLDNLRDGPLLHIARHYKPDVIHLYLSKEIFEYENSDHRYTESLKLLGEHLKKDFEIIKVERPTLVDVQDYNYFYDDFNEYFKNNFNLDKDDKLLINISSGTPAMKACLDVIGSLGKYKCSLIQVRSPNKKDGGSKASDNKYSTQESFELDEDNLENAENRCSQKEHSNLINFFYERLIKEMILSYNYDGALKITEQLGDEVTSSFKNLIKIAKARSLLDLKTIDSLKKEYNLDFFPIKDATQRELFEYGLIVKLKVSKNEYADFLRSLSPLIFDLFIAILKKLGLNINNYTKTEGNNSKNTRAVDKKIWDLEYIKKVQSEDYYASSIYNVLSNNKTTKIDETKSLNVQSWQLSYLINEINKNANLDKLVRDIRDKVESQARNIAAHQIVSITRQTIKNLTEVFYPEDIIILIEQLYDYTDLKIKKEDWKSYEKMNEYIISQINCLNNNKIN